MLLLGIILISIIFGVMVYVFSGASSSISLPVICVLGIISLLLCLAGISFVFVQPKLEDKTQPFELTTGSIQAVIALFLVVLFAIISVFVMSSSTNPGGLRITGLTATDRDDQLPRIGSAFSGWQPESDGKFTIFVRDPSTDTRNYIGKQLIVLIGTLMTSAVSFYFGARATVAGADHLGRTQQTPVPSTNPETGRTSAVSSNPDTPGR